MTEDLKPKAHCLLKGKGDIFPEGFTLLTYKEILAFKLWCWRRPLDSKEIKTVNPKGHQPWIYIERTEAEAEAPILRPPDTKSWLIGKDPDAGKDWGQEEKGMTEDEMVGWHHRLNGHGFEQTPGDSEGQESQACCSSWGCKESDVTQWLNNNSYILLNALSYLSLCLLKKAKY